MITILVVLKRFQAYFQISVGCTEDVMSVVLSLDHVPFFVSANHAIVYS